MSRFFPPSRPRAVEGGIKARSQRGAIGQTWWSERFIAVLEDIGMGNRLVLDDDGADGWRFGDTALLGGEQLPRGPGPVVLRIRSDDLDVRTDRTLGAAEVGFEADVVLVTFGGRHVDVVLAVGEHRLDAQVVRPPMGLTSGDRVLVAFDPRCAAAYGASGELTEQQLDEALDVLAMTRPPR